MRLPETCGGRCAPLRRPWRAASPASRDAPPGEDWREVADRALARGAAFKVEIAYRDGAEDVVSATVASRLSDLNSFQGVV